MNRRLGFFISTAISFAATAFLPLCIQRFGDKIWKAKPRRMTLPHTPKCGAKKLRVDKRMAAISPSARFLSKIPQISV
jgi:hypothetical protein